MGGQGRRQQDVGSIQDVLQEVLRTQKMLQQREASKYGIRTTPPASIEANLHHIVREPARTVDIVPYLKHNSLMNARKFANAQYITVLTPTEVLVYDDMGDLQRSISSTSILIGWRCIYYRLLQVPLKPVVLNNNTETMLIDILNTKHAINSAYKLTSSEELVRYLHACVGYPTKETWMKAIWVVNYVSWPGLIT